LGFFKFTIDEKPEDNRNRKIYFNENAEVIEKASDEEDEEGQNKNKNKNKNDNVTGDDTQSSSSDDETAL
jgi:hypothetical protein